MPRPVSLILMMVIAVAIWAAPAEADDGLIVKQSPYSVADTLDRLEKLLKAKGVVIFARIDHAAGAKKAGMELRPTQVMLFGNPKIGTPLMMANQRIGLDLPLKVIVWQDADGTTQLAYLDPAKLQARYAITGKDKSFETIAGVLGKMTDAAVKKE